MNIAIVGCGYVADFYLNTLGNHPHLKLAGIHDRDGARARAFAEHWKLDRIYPRLQDVLDDPQVGLVVNLTPPREHHAVSLAALQAGKHVYSEKPLAMDFGQARELVDLARSQGLSLSAAPCNVLSRTVRTLQQALAAGAIGRVFLAYAELDDGMIHREPYPRWRSASGKAWPWKDEFETGCTLEHAAYYVTWLVRLFGPVRRVTSFAHELIADKRTPEPLAVHAPDFSVACLEFDGGVVARVTCSIAAPRDRSLRIVGEDGVLEVRDCWNNRAPVWLRRPTRLRNWGEKYPVLRALVPGIAPKRYSAAADDDGPFRTVYRMPNRMDFSRGVAEQALAIAEGRTPSIDAGFALHVNEIVLCMQDPQGMGLPRTLVTRLDD